MIRKKTHPAKRVPTLFLKAVIWLIGLFILGVCIFVLPTGFMSDETEYYRPIIIGLYIPAIPFFFALYQAVKLLNYIDKNKVFSNLAVICLQKIKYSAAIICGLFIAGMPYIYYAADRDDAPGVLAIALVIAFASLVIASAAGLFQRLLQNAVDIKSENDLTV